MIQRKMMSNQEIYNTASVLVKFFQGDFSKVALPIKVNFYLQKNMSVIVEIAKELEEVRQEIINKYQVPSTKEDGTFIIPTDKVDEVTKELNDLFSLEQEVSIYPIKIDWFNDVNMTVEQFSALSYMIDEEEEEEI